MSGFEIEYGGKTWTVSPPTPGARDRLESLVVQTAWDEVEALRAVIPGALPELKAEYLRAVGAQEYKTGGRGWFATFHGTAGNTLFLLSLLREKHPEATVDTARGLLAERRDAVEAAFAVLVPGFFELAAGLPTTPPEQRKGFLEAARLYREKQPDSPPSSPTPGTT